LRHVRLYYVLIPTLFSLLYMRLPPSSTLFPTRRSSDLSITTSSPNRLGRRFCRTRSGHRQSRLGEASLLVGSTTMSSWRPLWCCIVPFLCRVCVDVH